MINLTEKYEKLIIDAYDEGISRMKRLYGDSEDKNKNENVIEVSFSKDYSKDFNIKFYGLTQLKIIYSDGKVIEIRKKRGNINYLPKIMAFKNYYQIETDDVITIVDMYFANEFSKEYIGKGIFDK